MLRDILIISAAMSSQDGRVKTKIIFEVNIKQGTLQKVETTAKIFQCRNIQ
jgi:hypothetical protein